MEWNSHPINQHEIVVHEVMGVHREDGVFPAVYPCPEFMQATGIYHDVQYLISNAGLSNFAIDEPDQYGKLAMSVVQDFKCDLASRHPMVHYTIYNKTVHLPFADFCAAIRVPQWGSLERVKDKPKPLMDLYKDICNGKSFSQENGKIRSIHLPSIR